MANVMVVYKTPKDPVHFDRHYEATHIPLAKKIPGLRSYKISSGTVASPSGESGVHLVAILGFDSMEAIGAGFASTEGRAAAADLANFASGGAELMMFETRDV